MTSLLYGALFLLSLLFALFLSVNFWPLLVLFLWIAIPAWLLNLWLTRRSKNRGKTR